MEIARSSMAAPPTRDGPRVNEEIDTRAVRLIGSDGENVGVVLLRDALEQAYGDGLDLVEISPNADPPVCKILDYGKFRYESQKKRNEAKKKQKVIEVKEVKLRPNINDHDYDVKVRSIRRFLDGGDKVKVILRFRGREMTHQDLGTVVLDRVRNELSDISKVEQLPKMEGRQMVMIIIPNKNF